MAPRRQCIEGFLEPRIALELCLQLLRYRPSHTRITDNRIESTFRFLAHVDNVRALKDRISRDIMDGLDAAGIEIVRDRRLAADPAGDGSGWLAVTRTQTGALRVTGADRFL